MQEIIYQVHTGGNFEGGDKTAVFNRFNFIEVNGDDFPLDYGFSRYEAEKPPRLIKAHLSSDFFKKTLENRKTKVIVVFRNPKDMLVSYYNFYRMSVYNFPTDGTWEEFFELFKKDEIIHGNYFDMQLSWWAYRHLPQVKIFKFEDMLKDPEQAVREVATFLEKSLSDDLIQKIVERTSFKAMKNNPMLNYSTFPNMDHKVSPFMRKGQVGDWKNYFSEEQRKIVDDISKQKFEPEGLFLEDDI